MRKINQIILGILFLGVLNSCEKDFDLNVKDQDNKIVANSVFNPDSEIKVEVLKSLAVTSELNFKEIENATVSLYENSQFIENLTYQKLSSDFFGKYISSIIPQEGKVYQIEVNTDNYDEIKASSKIPNQVNIIDVEVKHREWGDNNATSIRFDFSFKLDDPIDNDKYQLTMSIPVYQINATTNDTIFYANQYAEIQTSSLADAQKYLHNSLLFSDEVFNGNNYEISGTATTYIEPFGDYITEDTDVTELRLDLSKMNIRLHHLSDELYLYYSSHSKVLENQNDLYSEPTPIYSNIENGLGIFGGEYITKEQVLIEY